MNYSERVGHERVPKFQRQRRVELSPLHELVAPAIGELPGDLADQLKYEFYSRIADVTYDTPYQSASPGLIAPDWSKKYLAHDWLAQEVAALRRVRLDVAFDEEAIEEEARKWVAICSSLVTYQAMLPYVRELGVDVPEIKNTVTEAGVAKRFQDVRWWRRQFRKHYMRAAENKLRELGHIQKNRQIYASDRAVNWRRVRKIRDKAMLKELQAVSDQGDQLELWPIIEKSQANPALRRAELMVRMKGFEEIADDAGHVADFYTLTAPSYFHCTNKSGSHNPNYVDARVRQAQEWLCKMWARVRAKLKRLSILFYGFRIAEPHHDATPHWHVIMFYRPHDREVVRRILRSVWLSEFGEESGAQAHRTEVVAIDRAKGSACGYVSKYIAKNIDGCQVGEDFEAPQGTQASASCERVATWASINGIRQFQQIGGPQVGLWRELRRIRAPVYHDENCAACNEDNNGRSATYLDAMRAIENARQATEVPSWSAFIRAVGGIEVGRRTALRVWKETTGEVSRYGEVRSAVPAGVMLGAGSNEKAVQSKMVRIRSSVHGRMRGRASADDDSTGQSGEVLQCNDHPAAEIVRIRTRTKVWRIERKHSIYGYHEGAVSVLKAQATEETGKDRPAAPISVSSADLGPVSITVRAERTKNRLTLEEIAHRYLSRGDPPLLH
jgi:hypothetical protein